MVDWVVSGSLEVDGGTGVEDFGVSCSSVVVRRNGVVDWASWVVDWRVED